MSRYTPRILLFLPRTCISKPKQILIRRQLMQRGLIWNDDPSCLLFNDNDYRNNKYGWGGEWLKEYKIGSPTCLIQRGHFGDLYFLPGMATHHGEDANFTKGQAMAWLEVMHKLAIQEFSENDSLDKRFPGWFRHSSMPKGGNSLRDLLLGNTTAYRWTDISKRALGSCLHLVQYSCAVGHTLRRLRNPHDLNPRYPDAFAAFKPGTYAQLGPIIIFHTYAGQSGRLKHYDEAAPSESRKPYEPATFNGIIGARVAIDKCISLVNFYKSKTKWEDGVGSFFADEVFALDKNHTPSNSDVDEKFALPDTSEPDLVADSVDSYFEEEWRVGLERKLALLEGGLASGSTGSRKTPRILLQTFQGWYPVGVCSILIIMLGLAALLMFHVAMGS